MKMLLPALVLVICSNLPTFSFAAEGEDGFKAKCTWVESETNKDFFKANAYMVFHFIPDDKGDVKEVKIVEDTFLNRCEKTNPKGNCDMAFSYDENDTWAASDEAEGFDIVLTQVWRMGTEHGTVGGVSEIKGLNLDGGAWTISGDDGDGTWFTEPFDCQFLDLSFF